MAKAARFSTVPEELLHIAMGACAYLRMKGFYVKIEEYNIEFPQTPTLIAKRQHSTLFVEVTSAIRRDLANVWIRYASSCDTDIQFAFAIPNNPGVSQSDMEFCRHNKVGIYTFDVPGNAIEIMPPVDLAIRVALPELEKLPKPVRATLAPCYDKIERGDWRDGFADACQSVEDESRKYLKSIFNKPGLSIQNKNGSPIKLTIKIINKSTLGQLGGYFLGITTPSLLDSILATTLPSINPERIGAVHRRRSVSSERKLREKIGRRMHAIVNCLVELNKR